MKILHPGNCLSIRETGIVGHPTSPDSIALFLLFKLLTIIIIIHFHGLRFIALLLVSYIHLLVDHLNWELLLKPGLMSKLCISAVLNATVFSSILRDILLIQFLLDGNFSICSVL